MATATDTVQIGGHAGGFLGTTRRDAWWIEPLWTGVGFGIFSIYVTVIMFLGTHYYAEPYLSPMFSPLLFVDPSYAGSAPVDHAWVGAWPHSIWPGFLPASPALLILIFPLAFRLTCYYYRKFYYRAYFATPPACAVGPVPRGEKKYKGETGLFLVQNLHRYALYIGIFYIVILYVDAFQAFFKDGKFGVGVGTVIMLINPTLLACWTLGCHAFRHLTGGRHDCFSCEQGHETGSHKIWSRVTRLNEHHMFWAWVSMIWVGGTDVYIRLVSMGVIHDYNTW